MADEVEGAPMGETAERYRNVAEQFTRRAQHVPSQGWESPAPCDGWLARDVVRHLVEWVPGFVLRNWGVEPPDLPSVDVDPLGAWLALDAAIQAGLDDPVTAANESDSPLGRLTFEQAVATFCVPDVLVHTWDLARAAGLDEQLDAIEVHLLLESIGPMDAAMRASDHYGPRVDVPDDADEQTKLLAFTGRHP